MKKLLVILCLLAGTANAQNFGFTPQQIQFLDLRYWRTTNAFNAGLTTGTVFGGSGNVTGFWYNLTYNETDPIFGPWLTSFTATNVMASPVTADTTTITNNGSGQFSVALYSSNVFARLAYRQRTRDSLNDYLPGHINDATLAEMTNNAPLALTLSEMLD